MKQLTRDNLRHIASFFRFGRNPAAVVYDSIGSDFFLAPAPGWLNLGLWERSDRPHDGLTAVRRLVTVLAEDLPKDGVILDVANGLGAQDEVIAEVARPRQLTAVNITESQLQAGRERLRAARAAPVNGDATLLPFKDDSLDGIISVEAAFHFPSRARFFREARRVMRPGAVLTMSDVGAERMPRTPGEIFAGILNLRIWGLRASNMKSAEDIAQMAREAGFEDVRVRRVTSAVIGPAIRFFRLKLDGNEEAPALYRIGSRLLLRQWEMLARRRVIEYILLTAR